MSISFFPDVNTLHYVILLPWMADQHNFIPGISFNFTFIIPACLFACLLAACLLGYLFVCLLGCSFVVCLLECLFVCLLGRDDVVSPRIFKIV